MKKFVFALLLVAGILFFGCVDNNACGDGNCDTSIGENDLSCPEDCPSYKLSCVDGACVVVEGTGPDECSDNSDCI